MKPVQNNGSGVTPPERPDSTVGMDGTRAGQRIALWQDGAPSSDGPTGFITVHRPAKTNGSAVVICPGGGYGGLVIDPEGHGIARWLNTHGLVGVVLEYRLPGGNPFTPLLDAQRAIRLVRSMAALWGCDPHRIGIIGFSAGGHLAATASTHFDEGEPQAADPVQRIGCRPDFAILIYPVITMGSDTHRGSKENLLGQNPTAEIVDAFCNEKQVTGQTPPAFLAHARDDQAVPPSNSRMFFEALQRCKVPAQYIELPTGGHGLNHYQGPMWEAWQTQSLKWLQSQGMMSRPVAGDSW